MTIAQTCLVNVIGDKGLIIAQAPALMFLDIGVFPTAADQLGKSPALGFSHKVAKIIGSELVDGHPLDPQHLPHFLGGGGEDLFSIECLAQPGGHFGDCPFALGFLGQLLGVFGLLQRRA